MRATMAVCLVVTIVMLIGGCGGTGTVLTPNNIAFESDRDGNWEIYVMASDGTSPTNQTSNSADDYSPAWSPDGSQIAFDSDRDGNWEIYVMAADGSNQTNPTNSTADDREPAW